MATLTLGANGPTPNPVTASNPGRSLEIVNDLGAEVTLTLTPAGFLNPSPGATLTVPTSGWSGTVGASGGDYSYTDPSSNQRATRSGRIDVS